MIALPIRVAGNVRGFSKCISEVFYFASILPEHTLRRRLGIFLLAVAGPGMAVRADVNKAL